MLWTNKEIIYVYSLIPISYSHEDLDDRPGLNGIDCRSFEIGKNPLHDFTTSKGFCLALSRVLRIRRNGLLWGGNPCNSWLVMKGYIDFVTHLSQSHQKRFSALENPRFIIMYLHIHVLYVLLLSLGTVQLVPSTGFCSSRKHHQVDMDFCINNKKKGTWCYGRWKPVWSSTSKLHSSKVCFTSNVSCSSWCVLECDLALVGSFAGQVIASFLEGWWYGWWKNPAPLVSENGLKKWRNILKNILQSPSVVQDVFHQPYFLVHHFLIVLNKVYIYIFMRITKMFFLVLGSHGD